MVEATTSSGIETQRIAVLYALFTRPGRDLAAILTAIRSNCSVFSVTGHCNRPAVSTIDDVDRESPERCFLVLRHHVAPGVVHCLDDGVERDAMRAVAAQRQRLRVDR